MPVHHPLRTPAGPHEGFDPKGLPFTTLRRELPEVLPRLAAAQQHVFANDVVVDFLSRGVQVNREMLDFLVRGKRRIKGVLGVRVEPWLDGLGRETDYVFVLETKSIGAAS